MSRFVRPNFAALWLVCLPLTGCRLGFEFIDLQPQESPGLGGGDAGLPEAQGGSGQSPEDEGDTSGGGADSSGTGGDATNAGTGGDATNAGTGGSGAGGSGGAPNDVPASGGAPGNAGNRGSANGGAPDAAGPDSALCGNGALDVGEECEPSLSVAEDLCELACRFDWFDRAYAKRLRVRFDNAAATAALSGFVVPIPLDSGVVSYADLGPNGEDLLFVDADHTTELPYEIENWSPGGVSLIWVRVPSLDANSADYVWLYSRSPGAPARQDPSAVWDATYAAVFHLDGDAVDSKAVNTGNQTATAAGMGQLAGGLDFDGASSSVNAGSDGGLDELYAIGATLSAWIRPTTWGEGGYGRIADKASANVANRGWAFEIHNGAAPTHTLRFELGFDANFGGWNGPQDSIVLDTWSHVAVVKDGTLAPPAMYINGQAQVVTTVSVPAGALASDADLAVGIGDLLIDNTRSFDGVIDELRIERTLRDANWVSTEHRSALPGFVSFDAEQGI